jgi:hypothetical protein
VPTSPDLEDNCTCEKPERDDVEELDCIRALLKGNSFVCTTMSELVDVSSNGLQRL